MSQTPVPDTAVVVWSGGPAPGAEEWSAAVTGALHRRGISAAVLRNGLAHTIGSPDEMARYLTPVPVGSRIPNGALSFGRGGPARDLELAKQALLNGASLGIRYWFIHGGEGTAQTVYVMDQAAAALESELGFRPQIGQGAKSIDGDLPVPFRSIGFASTREKLGDLLTDLHRDALRADDRWFIVRVPGREGGHLASEAAVQSGGIWIIPEQFEDENVRWPRTFQLVRDICLGAILKGLAQGSSANAMLRRYHGHIVVAQGLPGRLQADTIPGEQVSLDRRGRAQWARFPFDLILARAVQASLGELGVLQRLDGNPLGVNNVTFDYAPRGCMANAHDKQLAMRLGEALVHQLVDEGLSGVIAVIENSSVGWRRVETLANECGDVLPVGVNLKGDAYLTGWAHLSPLRLLPRDLENGPMMQELCSLTGLSPESFRQRFAPVAEWGRVDE